MRALVLKNFGQKLSVEDAPLPDLGPEDVLIKVKASGLCSTDNHIAQGRVPVPQLPIILGHQCAGIVEAVGEDVTDIQPGDRVAPHLDIVCHDCFYCRNGLSHLCHNRQRLGFELNGTHAEYVRTRMDSIVKLPVEITFEQGSILSDAVATMYHAIVVQGKVRVGEKVVLYGIGGLGMQGIQILRLCGAKILVVSRQEQKLQFAKTIGANIVVNTKKENLHEVVMNFTYGRGADMVIDNIGGSWTVQESIEMVRPGGRVLLVGNLDANFQASSFDILMNEVNIIGCRASNKQDFIEVVELVSNGQLDPIVTDVFDLEGISEALQKLEEGTIIGRAVVTPS